MRRWLFYPIVPNHCSSANFLCWCLLKLERVIYPPHNTITSQSDLMMLVNHQTCVLWKWYLIPNGVLKIYPNCPRHEPTTSIFMIYPCDTTEELHDAKDLFVQPLLLLFLSGWYCCAPSPPVMDLLDLVFFYYQGSLSMEGRVEDTQSNITTSSTNSIFYLQLCTCHPKEGGWRAHIIPWIGLMWLVQTISNATWDNASTFDSFTNGTEHRN